ncbi:DNA polymerase zeta, partial [Linnemannia exigua]
MNSSTAGASSHNSRSWLSEEESIGRTFIQPGQEQEHQPVSQPGQQSFLAQDEGPSRVQTDNDTKGPLSIDEEEQEEQEHSIHVVQSSRTRRFKNRIADLDYTMAPPGPLDLQTCQFLPPHIPVQKVPVIRIYGANEAGQKTCVHIHQVYPYFYVQYKGSLEPAERYSYFLKIYLFNPDFESRIVDLMRGGAVMRTEFQPFEAHVPFRLQFFIDYNLYGMGWLELEDALLRNHVPAAAEDDHPKRLTKESVMDTRIWSPENDPGRISSCEIEMDTTADRIVNRDLAPERDTHFSLDECFKPSPSTAQVPSVAGLWEDDVRRRKANNLPSQEAPKTQIREPETIPWLNHDFNKRVVASMVKEMVQRQSQEKTPTQGDFENYMKSEDPLAESLMTAYESVEFLCPRIVPDSEELPRHQTHTHVSQDTSFLIDESESSVFVDESIILSQTAAKYNEDNMDTRKETFKGLSGLGGIDEQDEDDEDFPLPEMDMGDFQEEDFMDEAEFWEDEVQGSDRDSADPTSDDEPGYRIDNESGHHKEDDHIPQFDGGSDFPQGDGVGEKQETDEERWKRITIRRKRDRSTSSNVQAPSEQSPKAKRFRDLNTAGEGSSKPSTPPPILTRQRSRTAGVSIEKQAVPTLRKSLIVPPASFPSRPSSQDDVSRRLSASFLKTLHGKYILDHVAIPQEEPASLSCHNSSQNLSKKSMPIKPGKAMPNFFQEVEDDPIEDFDDEKAEYDEFGDLPIDALIDDEPDVIVLNSPSALKSPQESASSIPNVISPPSPRHNYFLSTLEDVWSSPSPPMTKPDFFFSPPRPRSPDLIPANSTTNKYMSLSSNTGRQTFASLSSSTPQTSPEKSRSSQRKRSSGALSDLSIINETVFPRKADLAELLKERDVKRRGSVESKDGRDRQIDPSESLDKLSSGVLVEDSIVVDEIETSMSPKEESPPPPSQRRSPPASNFKSPMLPSATQQRSSLVPQHTSPTLLPVLQDPNMPQHSLVQTPYNPHLDQALTNGQARPSDTQVRQFSIPPPTLKSLMSSLPELGLPNRVHQKPYFSNEADVPSKAKVFGGKEFRLQSKGLRSMPQFKGQFDLRGNPRPGAGYQFWEPNMRPPSYGEALAWLKEDEERVKASLRSAAEASTQQKREKVSQIEGPTQKNPFGCKNTPTKVASSIAVEKDFLDVLSLEVHCQTRGGLLPDPKFDPILAVFYCWQTDRENLASNGWVPGFHVGIITYEGSGMLEKLALGPLGVNVEVTTDEKAMLNTVIDR